MSQVDPLEGKYIVLPNGCWEWQGSKSHNGYGLVSYKGKQWRAHRLAYELCVGPIPAGHELDHLCRNRPCINPAHLEPVTRVENWARSPLNLTAINAHKTFCKRGHEFSKANTWVDKRGYRHCRTCYGINRRARLQSQKES